MKKILLTFLALSATTFAAEYEVKMLNIGEEGNMVFDPPVLHIEAGDTITFLPTQAGHYVESKIIPEGADSFKSAMDEKYSITLDKEGIYIYVCPPHQMMNMVGIIQVGKPINLEAVEAQIPKLARRAMQNKGRLEAYFKQLNENTATQ